MSVALARLLLVLAYPWIAHVASVRNDAMLHGGMLDGGTLAAIALGDLALAVLLPGLVARRVSAWLVAAALVPALVLLARSPYAQLPLLLVPVAFVALVAWAFGRTLRAGRVPLIARIVAALEDMPAAHLAPALQSYTRRLTAAWAGVLGGLAFVDLALASCAVPGGLLASVGIAPPVAIDGRAWSWFANGGGYVLIGAFFLGEFVFRQRLFPGRYRSFGDFLRRLAGLGPAFWRDLLRGGDAVATPHNHAP